MSDEFVEVISTDNQKVYIRKDLVGALEVITPSARVEGHIKLYTAGFKFLIKDEIEDLLRKLSSAKRV